MEALESIDGESDTNTLVAEATSDSSVLGLREGEPDSKFADRDGTEPLH